MNDYTQKECVNSCINLMNKEMKWNMFEQLLPFGMWLANIWYN